MSFDLELVRAIEKQLDFLNNEIDTTQRNLYIVAGVLGGVNLILIIAIIILFLMVKRTRALLAEKEIEKRVEEEMKAQKFATYTGEELHRKLMQASNPALPIGQSESEYAFNAPYVDNRLDAGQFGRHTGKPASRFSRQT